jgi:hypothetical protein
VHDRELACARHQAPGSADMLEVKAFDVSGAAYSSQHLFFSTMVQVEFRVACLEAVCFWQNTLVSRMDQVDVRVGFMGMYSKHA